MVGRELRHEPAGLVSTVCGNLYELSQFTGLKLLDVELPASFEGRFAGPRFGIPGTRRLTGRTTGPLVGTIIKPSVGLTPAQTADFVAELAAAGIDFVKDDELMADPPHSPLRQRVDAVMRAVNDAADRTGKRVMYAFNISDEVDAMLGHLDYVRRAGGTAVMVSVNSVGLSGTKRVCDQGQLPVHGHRNGWGAVNRHPLLGIDFRAYQKLWRLAGVDHLHVNGIANKFWEPDDSVVASIEACLTPLFAGGRDDRGGAGRLLRPDRPAGPRDLPADEHDRPAVHVRRRHHGPPRRAGRGRGGRAAGVGRGRGRRAPGRAREVPRAAPPNDREVRRCRVTPPLIAFYGDDFTGSTDALESLARQGVPTVLFTDPPTPDDLARHAGLQAFGVAGRTRAMPPAEMEAALRPALAVLRQCRPRFVHYKTCSTFDSSPTVGSIGRAIDVGMDELGVSHVPVFVAAPDLGRYCAFGNLFARSGTDPDVYRLDRHPSMSRHPVTPMARPTCGCTWAGKPTGRSACWTCPTWSWTPARVGSGWRPCGGHTRSC